MIDITGLREDKRPQSSAIVHALIDRLEAAEKERDQFKSDWLECLTLAEEAKPIIDRQRSEIDALRVKIEAMERQEPAGKFIQHPSNGLWEQDGYGDNPDARPLYALPGAKGEEK